MGNSDAGRLVPDDVLGLLQELVLTAVLLRQRLPGSRQLISIPGLEHSMETGVIELLDEHLSTQLSLDAMPTETQLRSADELQTPSEGSRKRYYLTFAPVERENGHIRLSLLLHRLRKGVRQAELVSGLDVVFQRDGERWRVAGEPVVFVI